MKIYLSHSLPESRLYLLTLLSSKAHEKGISVDSSYDARFASVGIRSSDFVLVLALEDGQDAERIDTEIAEAKLAGVPVLALLENKDGATRMQSPHESVYKIYFAREGMKRALTILSDIIDEKKHCADFWRWEIACGLALLFFYLIDEKEAINGFILPQKRIEHERILTAEELAALQVGTDRGGRAGPRSRSGRKN